MKYFNPKLYSRTASSLGSTCGAHDLSTLTSSSQ